MTLDLSDIEDICVSHHQQQQQSPEINSTVRIRKPVPKTIKTTGDCGEKPCNGTCDCEGLAGLFGNTDRDNEFSNGVVAQQQQDEVLQAPQQGIHTNDINPSNYLVYVKTWGCSHNNSDSEYMAGLLHAQGYRITTTDYKSSQIVVLNSCTVKGPSEQHFKNEIERAVADTKRLILAGCVPQSDKSYRKIASVIGVQQIDRIVEVVEEALRGNMLSFTSARRKGQRTAGADLSLPKIRKNELIEIVPISTGCLNNCTYCKTKQARGQLVSYTIRDIVDRISSVVVDGVKEIWLTSEDLGCWGIDLGLNIVDLLREIVQALPDGVMLRLGMTNPPYILDHLQEISEILSHDRVYEFLHIPVQSGSDSVLLEMKREYCRKDFERICDFMIQRHPNITIATDIICGYPTETEEDFNDTYELVKKYKFRVLFINQFYPRPGTHAASLKRIPTEIVKARTRKLNDLFQSYEGVPTVVVGGVQRVLVTEIAHDKVKYVGHNKSYQQVLISPESVKPANSKIMGEWVDVQVTSTCKFAMLGGDAVIVNSSSPPPTPRQNLNSLVIIALLLLLAILTMIYE